LASPAITTREQYTSSTATFPEVLANLNGLAGTAQTTRPVNKTLEYFLGRIGSAPVAELVQKMVNRLVRMKS